MQVPWHTIEEASSSDFTDHIAALEAMLVEMQQRVGKEPSSLSPSPPFPFNGMFFCRFLFRSGRSRPPSQPGPRPRPPKTRRTPWRT